MGDRGRTSTAEHLIDGVVPTVTTDNVRHLPFRAPPHRGLNRDEAALWVSIVNSLPVDWFKPGDLPLLAAYCRMVGRWERLSDRLRSAGMTVRTCNGNLKVNPVITASCLLSKQMGMLATKLRLTQQSRYTPQKAATAAKRGAKKSTTTSSKKPWED